MKRLLIVLVSILVPGLPAAADCVVTDHGATPNDETVDTRAIQAAIDACGRTGGGRVVVPPGRFLTGTVTLRRGIELHVGAGARLVGSPMLADYPPLALRLDDDHASAAATGATSPASGEGDEIRALLVAADVEDVALTGTGTIDGNGEAFWGEGFLTSGRARPDRPRPRPWLWFRAATRVTIRDLVLVNSPSYSLTLERVDDVLVSGVRIRNHPRSPNTDGIQVQGGRNVRIVGVDIRTGDDAIVLKSDAGPVENVLVSASHLESDDAAFKLGTGSRHPIRRVRLSDSMIVQSRYGIALFMKDGGSFEDCSVDDVDISTASRHPTDYPIYIDVDRRAPGVPLGRVRGVSFSNLRIRTRGNLLVQGHPAAPIEHLRMDRIDLRIVGPVDVSTLNGKPRGNALVQAMPDGVDYSRVSAHFTLAHVSGLVASDVSIAGADAQSSGSRHAVALIDVDSDRWHDLATDARAGALAMISIDGGDKHAFDGLVAGRTAAAVFAFVKPPATPVRLNLYDLANADRVVDRGSERWLFHVR